MSDFIYWLLREYGEYGIITHINSTTLDLETGMETLDQEEHEEKMALLPVSFISTYSKQVRSSADYGNLYAQGNSIVVLQTPSFEIHVDDVVTVGTLTFKVIELTPYPLEDAYELVVRA